MKLVFYKAFPPPKPKGKPEQADKADKGPLKHAGPPGMQRPGQGAAPAAKLGQDGKPPMQGKPGEAPIDDWKDGDEFDANADDAPDTEQPADDQGGENAAGASMRVEPHEDGGGFRAHFHDDVHANVPGDADYQHHVTEHSKHYAAYMIHKDSDPKRAEAHRHAANLHARIGNALHAAGETAPKPDPKEMAAALDPTTGQPLQSIPGDGEGGAPGQPPFGQPGVGMPPGAGAVPGKPPFGAKPGAKPGAAKPGGPPQAGAPGKDAGGAPLPGKPDRKRNMPGQDSSMDDKQKKPFGKSFRNGLARGIADGMIGQLRKASAAGTTLRKSGGGGPFIGPKGGKWADAAHTVAWREDGKTHDRNVHVRVKGDKATIIDHHVGDGAEHTYDLSEEERSGRRSWIRSLDRDQSVALDMHRRAHGIPEKTALRNVYYPDDVFTPQQQADRKVQESKKRAAATRAANKAREADHASVSAGSVEATGGGKHRTATNDGHEDVATEHKRGLYAVHKISYDDLNAQFPSIQAKKPTYSVTHLPTGMGAKSGIKTKGEAIAFANHMHEQAGDAGKDAKFGGQAKDFGGEAFDKMKAAHGSFKYEPKKAAPPKDLGTHKITTIGMTDGKHGSRDAKTLAKHGQYAVNGAGSGRYAVTHLPTGHSLKTMSSKSEAAQFAKHLHEVAPDAGKDAGWGGNVSKEDIQKLKAAHGSFEEKQRHDAWKKRGQFEGQHEPKVSWMHGKDPSSKALENAPLAVFVRLQ